MNLLRFFTAALLSMSLVGCCCSRCLVSDPCDPCGGMQPQGCPLVRWFHAPFSRGYGCEVPCGCTCGGCNTCGDMIDSYGYADSGCGGSCAAPSMMGVPSVSGIPASSGCNCGQSAQYSAVPPMSSPTYLNSAPTMSQPAVSPQPIPEVPPSSNYAPAPPTSTLADPQTMNPARNGQPQMVSYEEFQRLPGTVVSGPETTASIPIPAPTAVQQVSTSSASFVVPPAPSAAKVPTRFVRPGNSQQAVWTPARAN